MHIPFIERSKILTACYFMLAGFSCGLSADDEPLLFLGNQDIPPMIYLTESGPTGLVIDLANAIVERSEIPAVVDAIDWGEAQEKLASGEADALLQINSNPEREKIFDFSDPLLLSEFSLFRRTDRVDLQSMQKLKGHSVGVENKGYPKSILQKHPDVRTVIIDSWAAGFEQLVNREIDAILVDRWVGEFELSKLKLQSITVVDVPVETSYSTIAVKKGNQELLDKINNAIRSMREDGTYDSILDNWRKYEILYLTREQQYLYLSYFLLALLFVIVAGGVIYFRRIMIEQAQNAELNRKLEQANEELTQFAYRASHDLKSPLVSISRLANYVIEDMNAKQYAEAAENAERIRQQAARLDDTVTDVLALHRASSADSTGEQTFDLADLIKETSEKLAWVFEEGNCEFQFTVNPSIMINGQKIRFQQILENLISNGVKYRSKEAESSYVAVSTFRKPNAVQVVIADNGMGIPEKYHAEVMTMFKRFHQGDATGSGLGLAIVKKHVEALGGSVRFDSTKKGTTFYIDLPV